MFLKLFTCALTGLILAASSQPLEALSFSFGFGIQPVVRPVVVQTVPVVQPVVVQQPVYQPVYQYQPVYAPYAVAPVYTSVEAPIYTNVYSVRSCKHKRHHRRHLRAVDVQLFMQ